MGQTAMASKGFELPSRAAWPGPLTSSTDQSEYIYSFGEGLADQFPWDDPKKRSALIATADPRQIEFLGVWVVDGEICNGGLCQVFTNSFGALAEDAIAGFRRYGMSEFADLLDETYNIFSRPIPRDREARHSMLEERFGEPEQGQNLGMLSKDVLGPLNRKYFSLREGGEKGSAAGFEPPICAFLNKNAGLFFDL